MKQVEVIDKVDTNTERQSFVNQFLESTPLHKRKISPVLISVPVRYTKI